MNHELCEPSSVADIQKQNLAPLAGCKIGMSYHNRTGDFLNGTGRECR